MPKLSLKMGETDKSATPGFPPFRFSEFGNHICCANMIWKGACTNLLREKFSRTFGEKVACEARRMRCRTRSVRYLNNCFCMDNACYHKLHLISHLTMTASPQKGKPDGFGKTLKLSSRSGRLTSLQLIAFPLSFFPNLGIIFAQQIWFRKVRVRIY